METFFEISYFYSCVYLSKVSLNKHSEKNPNDILFFYLNCKKKITTTTNTLEEEEGEGLCLISRMRSYIPATAVETAA